MLGLKFKKFELKNGFVLFVGKDSDNNDELTTKFAKPNDIWLHSKDLGGSHCIIKNNNKIFPPKEIIEQAAEICAYYSKGRNSKYVPVLYTFKKNVVKPKGAKSGAVRVNKEEVIFVTPNLSV
jgi:predicted ribosome quality control (RQC) complex YloA/Tae2 family protein